MGSFGGQSMAAPLRAVAVKCPEDAFRGRIAIADQWRALGITARPILIVPLKNTDCSILLRESAPRCFTFP